MKRIICNLVGIFVFLTILLAFQSCNKKGSQSPGPPEIPVVEVIQTDVPIYREFVGQAYGLVDIPIRARVEGFLEEVAFQEGTRVRKGQLLYRIDAQPFLQEVAAQESKVAESQTYLVNATNELRRYEPLVKINAVSKSDYDAALATKEAAEASLKAAEANLEMSRINLSYTRILSPIDGLIGKTNARVGEFVGRSPNPVILNTVSDITQIRVQFFISETSYLALTREIPDMEVVETAPDEREVRRNVQLILADGTLYNQQGKIDFIDRNIDPMTGSMLVQASFDNPERILRPGMYTKVKILFGTVENALLVPQRCVMELQGQFSVYIVNDQNIVESRNVIVSERVGDLWLVEEGVSSGDKVVMDALQKVASGLTIHPSLVEFKSPTTQ